MYNSLFRPENGERMSRVITTNLAKILAAQHDMWVARRDTKILHTAVSRMHLVQMLIAERRYDEHTRDLFVEVISDAITTPTMSEAGLSEVLDRFLRSHPPRNTKHYP